MENYEYGVNAVEMEHLDQNFNNLMLQEITDAVNVTKTNVLSDLRPVWKGISEERFERDFDEYIAKLNQAIQYEYSNLQERLKDIAYNIYKADEDLYSSPTSVQ